VRGDGAIEARMFPVPGAGHAEDPATGAAAACLAAYLTRHTLELEAGPTSKGAGRHEWVVQQGAHIGRPSVLYAAADRDARGAVTRAYVGGAAVMVAYGALRL
jgi:PhzF family phenazine biosynthesis protein